MTQKAIWLLGMRPVERLDIFQCTKLHASDTRTQATEMCGHVRSSTFVMAKPFLRLAAFGSLEVSQRGI